MSINIAHVDHASHIKYPFRYISHCRRHFFTGDTQRENGGHCFIDMIKLAFHLTICVKFKKNILLLQSLLC